MFLYKSLYIKRDFEVSTFNYFYKSYANYLETFYRFIVSTYKLQRFTHTEYIKSF